MKKCRPESDEGPSLFSLSSMIDQYYWVYIMSNQSQRIYVGVTNDLVRRVHEHKQKQCDSFTRRYSLTWLVYYEQSGNVLSAITREKELKGWRRSRKDELVGCKNPLWKDLSEGWYEQED